jgi:hypothetical protein
MSAEVGNGEKFAAWLKSQQVRSSEQLQHHASKLERARVSALRYRAAHRWLSREGNAARLRAEGEQHEHHLDEWVCANAGILGQRDDSSAI